MESEGGGQSSGPERTGQSVPPSLPPGADCPALVSTPGRSLPPGPGRGAWPGAAGASTPSPHTRVLPPRLCPARSPGWCSRRLWAASNAALRASPAQPPPPPRRSPPPRPPSPPRCPCLPRPSPSGALFGRSLPGSAAGRAAGCSGASSKHNGRVGFPGTKPALCPLRCLQEPHWSACIFLNRIHDFFFPPYLEAGWAGLPRLCPASHPGCCMGFERSPSASGSRRARAGRAAGRAARGHSLRLALPSRRLARPPSR